MIKGSNVLDDLITVNDYVRFKINLESDEYIADKLAVSMNTLDRWKKKHKVSRDLVNQARAEYIDQKLSEGFTLQDIAKQLGLSIRNIYYISKHYLVS